MVHFQYASRSSRSRKAHSGSLTRSQTKGFQPSLSPAPAFLPRFDTTAALDRSQQTESMRAGWESVTGASTRIRALESTSLGSGEHSGPGAGAGAGGRRKHTRGANPPKLKASRTDPSLSHPTLGRQPQSQSLSRSQTQPPSQFQSQSQSQSEAQSELQSQSQSPALLADLRCLLGEMESRLGGFTRGMLQVADADGTGGVAVPAGAAADLDESTGPTFPGYPRGVPEAVLQELHVQ